ncbi:MAG: hypothetical protein H6707_00205 [Deltaproteobacteria bacterium]|nr:hypothetical protein [Deltaproteobacteria bacterium]
MKPGIFAAVAATLLLFASTAFAWSPTLRNTDGRGYKYKVACGASTLNSSIGSNTTTTISSYKNCTLQVVGVGDVKLKENMKCEIKSARLSCR